MFGSLTHGQIPQFTQAPGGEEGRNRQHDPDYRVGQNQPIPDFHGRKGSQAVSIPRIRESVVSGNRTSAVSGGLATDCIRKPDELPDPLQFRLQGIHLRLEGVGGMTKLPYGVAKLLVFLREGAPLFIQTLQTGPRSDSPG